ncbi:hypothetical protein F444_08380, partial [Phytophthora nicotianae P1976]
MLPSARRWLTPELHPRSNAEKLCYKANASFDPDQDGLVNSGHWNRFCRAQKKGFPNGAFTRKIDAFFNFIRAEGVPLDYLQLFKKVQKFSMMTVAELKRKAPQFPDGSYIVHAAQHYVEHCFALV